MKINRDEPINRGDWVKRIASELCLEESRIKLWHGAKKPDELTFEPRPLDLTRTPQELGLVGLEAGLFMDVWAEEAAVTTIAIRLAKPGQKDAPVELNVAPDATIESVIAKYVAQVGGNLTPAKVQLEFDGERLANKATLTGCDIEPDDLIDVKIVA